MDFDLHISGPHRFRRRSEPGFPPRFTHSPLKCASTQIRLLKLDLDGDPADIALTIRHVTLKAGTKPFRSESAGDDSKLSLEANRNALLKHSYIALSYTWGEETPRQCISLNGRSCTVNPNLASFLRQAKRRKLGDELWIDQLCIDQSTTEERNKQVQLMWEIYTGAKEVIVWLGPPEPGDSDTVQLIAEALRSAHSPVRAPDSPSGLDEIWQSGRGQSEVWAERGLPAALKTVGNKSYWGRIWVTQEIVLARHVVIWLGNHQLDGQALEKRCALLRDVYVSGDPTWRLLVDVFEARQFLRSKAGTWSSDESYFNVLLRMMRERQSRDPRDRFFGLTALLRTTAFENCVEVNYTKSEVEVFVSSSISLFHRYLEVSDTMTRRRWRYMNAELYRLGCAVLPKVFSITEPSFVRRYADFLREMDAQWEDPANRYDAAAWLKLFRGRFMPLVSGLRESPPAETSSLWFWGSECQAILEKWEHEAKSSISD